MKRWLIESLLKLCREWIQLDNTMKDKEFPIGSEWEFEELEKEYVHKTKQNVEKKLFEIVEELCQK